MEAGSKNQESGLNEEKVLYLEADEEITSAIDKMVELSSDKISIVVPKRSTLLQSIVNLKLLKKASADAGKELVLVTSDRTATHLAGRVGLPVAATLTSQPQVPEATAVAPDLSSDVIDGGEAGPPMPEKAEDSPQPPEPKSKESSDQPIITRKPIEPAEPPPQQLEAAGAAPKKRQSKIPDFSRAQRRLLWAGGGVALVILLLLANFFFASAQVNLFVKGDQIKTDFNFRVDTDASQSDPEKAVLAGQQLQLDKDLTAKFAATGKKDVGTPAKGTMTVYNGYDANPRGFPAGSRFIAPDGKVFRADSAFTVPGATVVPPGKLAPGQTQVRVTADQSGDQYNLAPARYTIPGQPSEVYGQGNQMSGGTSKQVTIVTQGDVEKAKTEAIAPDKEKSQKALEDKAEDDYRVISESFDQSVGSAISNPAVGAEATQGTLTLKVTYTELAVPEHDFKAMVTAQQEELIGSQNQIYDDGIDEAKITRENPNAAEFHFSTTAFAGAKIKTEDLVNQIKGKRYGDATEVAGQLPGVERVEIDLWPGWSSKLPRRSQNIKIELKVSGQSG